MMISFTILICPYAITQKHQMIFNHLVKVNKEPESFISDAVLVFSLAKVGFNNTEAGLFFYWLSVPRATTCSSLSQSCNLYTLAKMIFWKAVWLVMVDVAVSSEAK